MAQQIINIGAVANDGTGDTIRDGGDKINDNFTELYANIIDNVVVVNELSDFPAASGGKITLLANMQYLISSVIAIGTDYLELSDKTTIVGTTVSNATISYTGTSSAIQGSDVEGSIRNVVVSASGVGASVFALDNSANTKNFIVKDCVIANQDAVSVIDGFNIVLFDTVNFESNSEGLEFKNGKKLYLEKLNFSDSNEGAFINISNGTYDNGFISNCFFDIGSTFTGFDLDENNVTFESPILLSSNTFTGVGTHTNNYDLNTYFDIEQTGNNGIEDSVASASMAWSDNSGTYTQSGNNWVRITGGTSIADGLIRFSHSSPNELTYEGERDIKVKINVALTIDYNSGGSYVSQVGVFNNASLITDSENGLTVYAAEEPTSTNVVTELSQGDTIDIRSYKFGGGNQTVKASFFNVQINEIK